MRGFASTVAALLVLLNVVSSQELIKFTQCECLNQAFATDGSAFFTGAFTKQLNSGNVNTVACQAGADITGFPTNAGAVFRNVQSENWLTNVKAVGLYLQQSPPERLRAYAFTRLTITAAVALSSMTILEDGTGNTNFMNLNIIANQQAGNVILQAQFVGLPTITFARLAQVSLPVTVDIAVGEQLVESGGSFFEFLYICTKFGAETTCSVLDVSISGFAQVNAGDSLSMRIFEVTSSANALTIEAQFLEFGHNLFGNAIALSGGAVEDDFEAAFVALTRNPATQIQTIPGVASNQLTVAEDGSIGINLFNNFLTGGSLGLGALTFTVDKTGLGGATNPAAVGTLNAFTYDPADNFFGDESFTFAYGNAGLNCFHTGITVNIDVTPVDDAPVAVNPSVQVFGTVLKDLAAEAVVVATDVDFGNGLLSAGTATISAPLPDGVLSNCAGTNFVVGSQLAIENGAMSFCFLPNDGLVSGSSSNFNFVISDGTTSNAVNGRITFVGNNPVQALVNNAIEATEDGSTTFTANTLGRGENNIDFQVRIKRLPQVGTLQNNADQSAVTVNQEFAQTAVFRYVPPGDFFNANAAGGANTEANVPIPANLNFQYEVFRGTVVDGPQTSPIKVRAVDDRGTTVVNNGEEERTVNSALAKADNFISVSETGIVATSDGGNNVFKIRAQIDGSGEVKFLMKNLPAASTGFVLNPGSFQGNARSCDIEQCDSVVFVGVPSQVNQVFRDLEIKVPAEPEVTGDQAIVFQVIDFGGSFNGAPNVRVAYLVEFEEIPFFDQLNNQLMVGGIGGGALFILVAFGIYRVTRAREVGEISTMKVAENNVVMDLEKRRNRRKKDKAKTRDFDEDEEAPPPKKGDSPAKAGKADGDPMDWEKHMDPDTKQTYFFNPNTGESRWDPPDV